MVLGRRIVTPRENAAIARALHGSRGATPIVGSCCVCRDQKRKQRKTRKSCVICGQPVCNEHSVCKTMCIPLHQRQAISTWWCSPLPCTGEGRNGLSIPRGSHPRAILPWTTLLIFYPCCPMRGHMWTALLNPIDRPLPLLFSLGHLFLVPPSTPNLFITHPTHR